MNDLSHNLFFLKWDWECKIEVYIKHSFSVRKVKENQQLYTQLHSHRNR